VAATVLNNMLMFQNKYKSSIIRYVERNLSTELIQKMQKAENLRLKQADYL